MRWSCPTAARFTKPHSNFASLPAELIRLIARTILGTDNWKDVTQLFALRSLAQTCRTWRTAIQNLTSQELPYKA